CFFFNDTATTEIYPLSLHDALPIYHSRGRRPFAESASPRLSALQGQVTESCVQFAVAFLATDLVDVTMLIAHHLPGLRREARAWPQDPGRFVGVSMGAGRAILVASACNEGAWKRLNVRCVRRSNRRSGRFPLGSSPPGLSPSLAAQPF